LYIAWRLLGQDADRLNRQGPQFSSVLLASGPSARSAQTRGRMDAKIEAVAVYGGDCPRFASTVVEARRSRFECKRHAELSITHKSQLSGNG
jgi:hypothetical protein